MGENVRRVADEAPDKLKQAGDKLNEDVRAAKQNFDEFGKNTQKGIANVKENTREGFRFRRRPLARASYRVLGFAVRR